MKILVFERMSELDEEISRYLTEYHKKDDIKALCNLEDVSQEELVSSIKEADMIVFQTLFADETSVGFLDSISILLLRLKWFKEVRILKNTDRNVTEDLNFKILEPTKMFIKNLMDYGMQVSQIFVECYQTVQTTKKFFKDLSYFFDIVGINYELHEEVPFFLLDRIPYIITNFRYAYPYHPLFVHKAYYDDMHKLYKNYLNGKKKKPVEGKLTKIKRKFGGKFDDLMDEIEHLMNYRIECQEESPSKASDEIIKESQIFLNIINSLK